MLNGSSNTFPHHNNYIIRAIGCITHKVQVKIIANAPTDCNHNSPRFEEDLTSK